MMQGPNSSTAAPTGSCTASACGTMLQQAWSYKHGLGVAFKGFKGINQLHTSKQTLWQREGGRRNQALDSAKGEQRQE